MNGQSKTKLSSLFTSRTAIIRAIAISPALVIFALLETFSRDAYPSEGDSLFIAFAHYLAYYFPFWFVVYLNIDRESQNKKLVLFWNLKRNGQSLATLVVSFFPFTFWLVFLLVSVSVGALGSTIICLIMLYAIPIARTLAIQDVNEKPELKTGSFSWADVDSRCAHLDEKYETLRKDLDSINDIEA